MIDYSPTLEVIHDSPMKEWMPTLCASIEKGFDMGRWGDLPRWEAALKNLPKIQADLIDLTTEAVKVGCSKNIDEKLKNVIEENLRQLHPWRKGPFNVFDIFIDAEWRSHLKWDRLKGAIAPLAGRRVLDIGCGNGYYDWRMAGEGAKLVVGIEPTLVYVYQFHALQHYIGQPQVSVFPISIEDMPEELPHFDTVFSMGLLYHRRSPLDHLAHLRSFLRDEGELVLETLVVDGKAGDVLSPVGRYANMSNAYFIPSVPTLEHWLARCGFNNIRLINVAPTTTNEQRKTDWMNFQSLNDFLDPTDPRQTIEGYPAPQRAILLADR